MESRMPTCGQTHSGATEFQTLQSRAAEGDEWSQLLLKVWEEKVSPFLASLGEKESSLYGVIHGDLNPGNFFFQEEGDEVWIFDFDQAHHNWFGFDLGVVLQMVQFFVDTGIGGPLEEFDGEQFKKIFLEAYREAYPPMDQKGHLTPTHLKGFYAYREFYVSAVMNDIVWQANKQEGEGGKRFGEAMVNMCKMQLERFKTKVLPTL